MTPDPPSKSPPAPARTGKDGAVSRTDVDQFLDALEQRPVRQTGGHGRLVFAMDATASRERTWDTAMSLQGQLFKKAEAIGSLDVQLVFYRGYRECRSSRWINSANELIAVMSKVRCLAGRTQIARILEHAAAEARTRSVQALVFVGDAVEEPVDTLGDLAGRLKLLGVPVFVFQEGHDPVAHQAFAQIAAVSGGAHCRFDENSADELGRLLEAVAAYATGGREALAQLGSENDTAQKLLRQID